MDRRGNHAPMDFTYDNGVGPVNPASPFMNVGRNGEGLKRAVSSFTKHEVSRTDSVTGGFAQISPSKSQPASLRAPASSHSYLFSLPTDANKPLPPRPKSQNTQPVDFITPRKPQDSFDLDTSGGETPNTPNNADSEATPDPGMGPRGFVFGNGDESPSPKKKTSRRESFFTRMNVFGTNPGGRGEIPRGTPYSHKIENRVNKKRAGRAVALVRPKRKDKTGDDDEYVDVDSDSDEMRSQTFVARSPRKNRKVSSPRKARADGADKPQQHGANSLGSFFNYLESHPNLPAILSWYAQLLCNCFFVFILMYFVYSAYTTIQADVDEAAASASAEVLTEIALCAKQYKENECDSGRVLPAMVNLCKNWEGCMARDPRKIGRARVSAHTFARIFNSFIEPISWKAMIFSLLVIFGTAAVSNFAFGFFRSRHAGAASFQPQGHMYHPQIPATPSLSRHASGNAMLDGSVPGYWTPHPHHQTYLAGAIEPAPSASPVRPASDELKGSPGKRNGNGFGLS